MSTILDQAFDKVDKKIKENEISNLLLDLIKIESHKESKMNELPISRFIDSFFKSESIESEIDFVTESRPNIYARIGGEFKGKSLMFNGHIDTVPSYNMPDAFNPKIYEGVISGRGAVDMKGAIAAMMIALVAIKRADILLRGTLFFTGVIDEEQRCIGTKRIVELGYPHADYAIVGEPTNLQVMVGHKGMEWLEITVYGQSSHGSTPDRGVNAILQATKLINVIEKKLMVNLKNRNHPLLGEPTLNIGVIQGGVDPNVIPNTCKICVDRRWVPEETTKSMIQDFEKIICELNKNDPTFKADVRRMSDVTGIHEPLYTPSDHVFVKQLQDGMQKVINQEIEPGVFQGWSDAAQLSSIGITSVVCGPGDIKYAHSDDEQIPISEVVKAARFYAYMALKVCM